MIDGDAAISISHLTVSYGSNPALVNISVEIPRGSVVGIIGPNGAGKSTLIKSVMGFVDRDYGRVSIYGEVVENARGRVAYVPQRGQIDWDFPVTVSDVVLMGRYSHVPWYHSLGDTDRQVASKALRDVGMEDVRHRQIGQLSGGQQQRVFMARALAQESDILLLDEPFAGVDPISVGDIKQIIQHLKDKGIGVLITDHNVRETLDICDKAYIVNDGHIIAEGDADTVLADQTVKDVYLGHAFRL